MLEISRLQICKDLEQLNYQEAMPGDGFCLFLGKFGDLYAMGEDF